MSILNKIINSNKNTSMNKTTTSIHVKTSTSIDKSRSMFFSRLVGHKRRKKILPSEIVQHARVPYRSKLPAELTSGYKFTCPHFKIVGPNVYLVFENKHNPHETFDVYPMVTGAESLEM